MEYISAVEAAGKWGVTGRQVQRLAAGGRIDGAVKFGAAWQIPAAAGKPDDPRRENKAQTDLRTAYSYPAAWELPKAPADANTALHPLLLADNAYRRGDCGPAKAIWQSYKADNKLMLPAASLTTAAAISSGDYALYYQIRDFLKGRMNSAGSEADRALLSLPETLAAVSMSLPEMTPEWLKLCDFSLFPAELRPFLLYLHALHLRNIGEYSAMLAAGGAALTLCEKPDTFTWIDLYLGVLCAEAAYILGKLPLSERYLTAALELGMPWGFIAPFADNLGEFGGRMEAAVGELYPGYRKQLLSQWDSSFKNWMRFRNEFAAENITTVLTSREYHVARLISRGATYAETARQMNFSVSRVKSILSEVYSKLYIQKKSELNAFIL